MGIIIAAAITTAVVVALYGHLIYLLSVPADRRALLITVLIALPLQPLAFYFVRLPLDAGLRALIGTGGAYAFLTTFYAPLTEEPAKWLALAVTPARRLLKADNIVPVALAVGLGFGIGEIWFLAEQLHRVPQYAALPFWMFGGFVVERSFVCFLHGGFVLFVVERLATGRPLWPGALIGMALHHAVNFPIYLAGIDAFGLGADAWTTIASLFPWLVVLWLGMRMNALSKGKFRDATLGYSTCPECKTVYPRPLLALNLGPVRYERCPNCRKFHIVPVMGQPKRANEPPTT